MCRQNKNSNIFGSESSRGCGCAVGPRHGKQRRRKEAVFRAEYFGRGDGGPFSTAAGGVPAMLTHSIRFHLLQNSSSAERMPSSAELLRNSSATTVFIFFFLCNVGLMKRAGKALPVGYYFQKSSEK